MKISLVLPAYKKEKVIVTQLKRLGQFFDAQKVAVSNTTPNSPKLVKLEYELIVIVDGNEDATRAVVFEYIQKNKLTEKIKLYDYDPNKGKGFAIRYGMQFAQGDILGYTDADTDVQMKSFEYALKAILEDGVDIVAPSKLEKEASVTKTAKREIISKGFQFLSRKLLDFPEGVQDVSCGLKLFTREAVDTIFPLLTVNRFAIDSEIMFWAKRNGFTVRVVPFFADLNNNSTSATVKQIFIMLRDLIQLAVKSRAVDMALRAGLVMPRVNLGVEKPE